MEIEANDLHHYGIIAGICDELNLVNQINNLVKSDPQKKVSIGDCVKAMIINGLGYTTRPMYLASQFFQSKPMKLLFGKDISPEDLNDNALGRALDKLYENNCTKIFSHIALNAATLAGVNTKFRHLDTTNMQVHGEYEDDSKAMPFISFGYAKQRRADLKQFVISLMVSADGGIPLFAESLPGNTSGKQYFKEVLQTIQANLSTEDEYYMVLDSAAYDQEMVKIPTKWITRVPDTIKQTHEFKKKFSPLVNMIKVDDDYSIAETTSKYGGIEQRWLIVFSKHAQDRAKKSVARNVEREKEELKKITKRIKSTEFACVEDAKKAIAAASKKLKYHIITPTGFDELQVFLKPGRPSKNSPKTLIYEPKIEISEKKDFIDQKIKQKSMFVLATSQLDDKKLSNEEILSHYKDQYKAEQGFRFLKDPLCLASSVYLKNQERIIALAMIMCLCLLIYGLLERKLRIGLLLSTLTVPDQKGKPTKTPTMRWIFEMFEGVILMTLKAGSTYQKKVVNLSDQLKIILQLLGEKCTNMYLLES